MLYIFVFLWTPALQARAAGSGSGAGATGAGKDLPFGVIFSLFMLWKMAGSRRHAQHARIARAHTRMHSTAQHSTARVHVRTHARTHGSIYELLGRLVPSTSSTSLYGAILVFVVSAAAFFFVAMSRDFALVLLAFLVYEMLVGMYWPERRGFCVTVASERADGQRRAVPPI